MIYAILAVLILILDQGVKFIVHINLDWYEEMGFIPGFISLYKIPNPGGAFGMFSDSAWFAPVIVVAAFLISGVIIYCIAKKLIKPGFGAVSAIFVLSGAMGNCIDRLITGVQGGYVTDMFKFVPSLLASFAVFNVADIFLVLGGLMFSVYFIKDADDISVRSEGRVGRIAPVMQPRGQNVVQMPGDQTPQQGRIARPQAARFPEGQGMGVQRQAGRTAAGQPNMNRTVKPPAEPNMPNEKGVHERGAQPDRIAEPRESTQQRRGAEPRRGAQPRPGVQPARRAEPKRNIDIAEPEYNLDDILSEFSSDD